MGRTSTYSPEIKAKVIAEWQLGTPKSAIARKVGVSRGYVQQVTRGRESQALLSAEKQVDLGELVYELIAELARGSRAIAVQLQDKGWLAGQPADALAISLGVAIDKMAGLIGAINRGRQDVEHPALPPGPG